MRLEQRRLLSADGGCSRIHGPDGRMITKSTITSHAERSCRG
ncbi:hypothetical protein ABZ281_36485 [Streptomyces sp. NPDC006265]